MTQGTVGWICPSCKTIYAPWQTACEKCVPASLGTLKVSMGTLQIGFPTTYSGTFSSGTFFMGPRPTTPPPPTYQESRADEVITAWKKDGGWSKLRELIVEAMDDAVANEYDEDDDDE